MIDVMSEISIISNKNVQEFNHYIISLLHSDVRLEGLYNDQTITMKTQLHLHLPQASDWGHEASGLLVVAEVLFSRDLF
jgi:hypothetical protein